MEFVQTLLRIKRSLECENLGLLAESQLKLKQSFLALKKQKGAKFVLGAVLVFTIVRLLLYWRAPYYFINFLTYDDMLLLNYVPEILKGNWLGTYTPNTLAKGISYPLFIVWGNKLHLPYGIFFGIFQIAAAGAITNALKGVTKNKYVLLVIYLFFLYSPITFMNEYSTRLYRNGIVIPAVLIIFASIIALYFRREAAVKRLLPWHLALALMLPFYWYIREDSIWILPFFIAATAITIYRLIFKKGLLDFLRYKGSSNKKGQLLTKIILLCLPLATLFTTNQMIKKINQDHYGVAVVNDRTEGPFAATMTQLIRLDDGTNINQKASEIWISKKAFKKAMTVSPTLNSAKKDINWLYNKSGWAPQGQEIAGDIVFWAVRTAMEHGGYYDNAKKADVFWQKVTDELATAYKTGKISEKKEIYLTSTGDGKTLADIPKVLSFMKTGIIRTTIYREYRADDSGIVATDQQIKSFSRILRLPLMNQYLNQVAGQSHTFVMKVGNWIIKIYQLTSPVVLLLMVVGCFVLLLGFFFSKNKLVYFDRGIIGLGLLLTYGVFMFGIAWFCSWSTAQVALMRIYTGAGVPILQIVDVIAIVSLGQLITAKYKNRQKK